VFDVSILCCYGQPAIKKREILLIVFFEEEEALSVETKNKITFITATLRTQPVLFPYPSIMSLKVVLTTTGQASYFRNFTHSDNKQIKHQHSIHFSPTHYSKQNTIASATTTVSETAAMFNTQDSNELPKPLVVVGSINADLVLEVPRLPKPGETLSSTTMNVYPGGKGANQAAAAAKLGYPTQFVGQVGRDAYAPMLRTALADCGVDTTKLHSIEGSSGLAFIMLQPSGENSIVLVGGANTSEEWQIEDDVTAAIQSAGAVLLQREIPETVNVIFAKLAAGSKIPVILDAGGADRPLAHDLLPNISILSPNETELQRLTGLPTKSEKQCIAAAEALVHQGVNKVLVKMGAKGSLLVDIYGNVVRQKAVPVLKIEDTTGAGDCFTSAYAVAMLEGKCDSEAMEFAGIAASLCIQRQGAIPSMPTRAEVERETIEKRKSSGGQGGGGGGGGGKRLPSSKVASPTLPKQSYW